MIQALVIFLFYILGPILVLVWAVKRYRSGVKPDFIEVVAVVLAVALITLIIVSNSGNITDTDQKDVDALVNELAQRYPFPVQAKYQDRPAVYGEAQRRSLDIRIYGVTDTLEQEKIVELVRKLRQQMATKTVAVKFFQAEVWEETPEGTRVPHRERETLIHKYLVE